MRPDRLLLGYSKGIFPWYADNLILWHSPNPRMVMSPHELIVQRSLRKNIKRKPYRLTMDTAFVQVMSGCADVPRPGQTGKWLLPEVLEAYTKLHELGFAHSVEAWLGDELVGGLYGVSLGGVFFGESMFSRATDASKIAFVAAVRQLGAWRIGLVDCETPTEHLARFGAHVVSRTDYLELLARALVKPTKRGPWTLDIDLDELSTADGTAPDRVSIHISAPKLFDSDTVASLAAEAGHLPTTDDVDHELMMASTVVEQIERSMRETPDAPAILSHDGTTSYRELDTNSARLAAILRREGVGLDRTVAVIADRSVHQITGFIAALRAGGAYLPIKPDLPDERIALMLEETAPVVILCDGPPPAGLAFHAAAVVRIDQPETWPEVAAPPEPSATNTYPIRSRTSSTPRVPPGSRRA